jgi:hypothetical protein
MTLEEFKSRWPELAGFIACAVLSGGSLTALLILPPDTAFRYVAAANAVLSIGTGGLVSFVFYYLVNARSERRRRTLLHGSVARSYREAKEHIAWAILHASQKGGRNDLEADVDTHAKVMTVAGFKALFEGGRQSHEGFYAFTNQMSDRTPEFDEIILSLRAISRAAERLTDTMS